MTNLLSSWGNLIYMFLMITSSPGFPETKPESLDLNH